VHNTCKVKKGSTVAVFGLGGVGLSVVQGDPERDLANFPAGAFDYVVLSFGVQRAASPRALLREAGRVGARVVVTINNAGFWKRRAHLAFKGRTADWDRPLTACSVRDVAELARSARLSIETAVPMTRGHAGAPFAKTLWRANWFADDAIFVLLA